MEEQKIVDAVNLPATNDNQTNVIMEIQPLIQNIRGQQVMLDSDLARLYGVETKVLNQAVKRNIQRFPDDFRFQLTAEECSRSQIVTLNGGRGSNMKYFPYAFTEQGISMLSSVLRSPTAIEVNIRIMRAFVAMRHFLADNAQVFKRLETLEHHQLLTDNKIDEVFKILERENKTPQQGIFFDGQIFDAYSFVSDLIRRACKRIVLIDNYVDDTVLTMLDKRGINVSAKIYTAQLSQSLRLDLERHNSQYAPITIDRYRMAHDRFLIIDEEVYHIGASIKDLGKKLFGFSLMKDLDATELLTKIGVE